MDIKILQLKEEFEHKFLFREWEEVEDTFDLNNYAEIWNGTIEALGVEVPSTNNIFNLNVIYEIFNTPLRPENFCGHSLSISDIVVIDGTYYFCDSFGWTKID